MRRLRPLLLLAVAASLLLPPAASAAEVGLNINGGAGAQNDPAFASLGHGWNRYFVHWYDLEPTRGQLNTAVAEQYKRIGATDGRKSLFVLTGTPGWANGGAGNYAPPTNAEDFGSFAQRFARILGAEGDAYEIWNEPDGDAYWWAADRDNPARYVALLKSAYSGIKAVSPASTVVFGPMTGNNYAYVDAAYKAGAKGSFDAMSVHTDTACLVDGPSSYYRDNGEIARWSFLGYRTVRKVMLAHGDDKPIWMSELGWTNPPDIGPASCARGTWAGQKPQGVNQETQAQFLREAYHCLKEDPYVTVAMWFNSRDTKVSGEELDNYGLLEVDGAKRLAYDAFAEVASGIDRITGPCGDFEAPRVQILEPAAGESIGKGDRLTIRATSPDADVVRMTFAAGGGNLQHFSNVLNGVAAPVDFVRGACAGGCGFSWFGASKLPVGTHSVDVLATDARGNVGKATAQFSVIDPATVRPQKVGFGTFRLKGRGRKRVLTGSVSSKLRFKLRGALKVEWRHRRGGRWKKVHGGATRKMTPFRFAQTLKYPGTWRVRLVFRGQRPFRSATSCWTQFSTASTKTRTVCGRGATKPKKR